MNIHEGNGYYAGHSRDQVTRDRYKFECDLITL